MALRLFILFSVVPVIEIWLLIQVGKVIGGLPTVALLLAISATGALLARHQGIRAFITFRNEIRAHRVPTAPLIDGALIFVGAVLLVTPGFFTDFLGLFFLIPATRNLIKKYLRRRLERVFFRGTIIHR